MVKERKGERDQIKEREREEGGVHLHVHLHSLFPVYLGYFQLLSKDMPVSPHYGVAWLAHTASSHLKCMLE